MFANNIPLGKASEMAERIRLYDWSQTALGPAQQWSRGFSTALDLCLGSRLCSAIYWGQERLVLYNDAYSALLGSKHPWALGRTADDVWAEVFDVIGPLMQHTLATGEATGADDAAIFLNRSGYVEEFYCSFSYSPLVNEFGDIEGVFTMFPETTLRVIGERRLNTLQQLAAGTRELRHPRDVLEVAAKVFTSNDRDIPFAGLYLWNQERSQAHLCATSNIDGGATLCPTTIDIDDDNEIARLMTQTEIREYAILDLGAAYSPIPTSAWKIPAEEMLFLPFERYGEVTPKAFMLCGVNPHKRLDEAHSSFFRMLADQVSGALAEAFSHEQEDVRLRELQERARAAQQEDRVRIARDLHDTLLQSMQGLRFLLEAAIERSKIGDDSAGELFERALDASVFAIDEGRAVLSLLRSSAPEMTDLTLSIATLGDALVSGSEISFELEVNGNQRELNAALWNDIYGICKEAVANAARHSHATSITLELLYAEDLSVRVRDDGCGIDSAVASTGRPGHFGLQGMRERSEKIGGSLNVESHVAHGTTVELNVPGSIAYANRSGSVD